MRGQKVSVGRAVLAGLIAGAVGALLANLAAWVLSRQFGQTFEQLNWYSISRASMISCTVAGVVYYGLTRFTQHPLAWFVVFGLAVAIADSVLVALHSPEAGFARVANPLHFVVAVVALVLIPALAPIFREPRRESGNMSASIRF